jgi:cytochrome c biogenesis factor
MLSLPGTLLLASGFLAVTLAAISYGLATRGNTLAFQYGPIGALAALGMTLLTAALLAYAFATRRYDITYIYHSIAVMLAGQAGSFLVWARPSFASWRGRSPAST